MGALRLSGCARGPAPTIHCHRRSRNRQRTRASNARRHQLRLLLAGAETDRHSRARQIPHERTRDMNARSPVEAKPPRMERLARLPVFFALTGKRVVLAGGTAAAAWKAE